MKPVARLGKPLCVLCFCPRASNTGWGKGLAQPLVFGAWGGSALLPELVPTDGER